MSTRVSFHTFGCRLNQSETASLENSFEQKGFTVVDIKAPCDIVVINTCTVTQGGDTDTRRLVNRVNRLHPNAQIALVGCQAQVQKEQLAVLPNVAWIVGNERKMELAKVLADDPKPVSARVIAPTINRIPFTQLSSGVDRQHRRANLKVQDGCDFFCSFCEIPYARGRARSRVFEDIMREAGEMAKAGHREVVLTGINLGTYSYEGKGLADIIAALETIDGITRIRISSIEPTTVPPQLFDHMRAGKVCRYLHVPLQSGHDDILKAMARNYTQKDFSDFIGQARSNVDNICIGTDVMVGFPGEKQEHFEATADYLRDGPIDYFHVFSYSPRFMAKSRLLAALPSRVVSQRSKVLRELSDRKRRLFHERLLGKTFDVLMEEFKDGYWSGLTDNYIRVFVKANGQYQDKLLPVKLTACHRLGMAGEIV